MPWIAVHPDRQTTSGSVLSLGLLHAHDRHPAACLNSVQAVHCVRQSLLLLLLLLQPMVLQRRRVLLKLLLVNFVVDDGVDVFGHARTARLVRVQERPSCQGVRLDSDSTAGPYDGSGVRARVVLAVREGEWRLRLVVALFRFECLSVLEVAVQLDRIRRTALLPARFQLACKNTTQKKRKIR